MSPVDRDSTYQAWVFLFCQYILQYGVWMRDCICYSSGVEEIVCSYTSLVPVLDI